jgi:hypothetical protein
MIMSRSFTVFIFLTLNAYYPDSSAPVRVTLYTITSIKYRNSDVFNPGILYFFPLHKIYFERERCGDCVRIHGSMRTTFLGHVSPCTRTATLVGETQTLRSTTCTHPIVSPATTFLSAGLLQSDVDRKTVLPHHVSVAPAIRPSRGYSKLTCDAYQCIAFTAR